MRSRIDRHAITPLWLRLPSNSFCQRSTIEGVIWRSCRRPKVGAQVAAQITFGGLHALGAAPGAGGPELPPVVGPLVEQDAAAARVGPGVGGDLGEQFVLEISGQPAGVEVLAPWVPSSMV
jgi:hypothetical protein